MNATELITLTPAQFAAVIALFLPGFVSLRIDRLIHPGRAQGAADDLLDILGYSLLNAGVFSWAILIAAVALASPPLNYWLIAGIGLLVCIVGPTAWPFIFRGLQGLAARRGWVAGPHRVAWDHVFARREYGFVIVHLRDGSHIGGYFGERSYATVEPESGHLYLEELWTLDAQGRFGERIPDTRGGIFRPADYLWVEFFEDDADET